MKRRNLFSFALVALMLGACSDEKVLHEGDLGTTGDGYVKIAINLPTTSGVNSRTGANDNFDDGLITEYQVNNAIIALFKGAKNGNEADAEFVTAKSLNLTGGINDNDNDNVTVRYTYTVEGVPVTNVTEQMYALVILNSNNLCTYSNGTLTINGGVINAGTKFRAIQALALDDKLNAEDFTGTKNDSFFMTNAPISNIPSVTASSSFTPQVTTLAKVTVHATKPTTATIAEPIYVERAVAKVEVEVSGTGHTENTADGSVTLPVIIEGQQSATHKVKFTQWALNVTNKSSYLVRNVSDYKTWAGYYNSNAIGTKNRFFGEASGPYRVYWAIDKNYDETGNVKDKFNHFTRSEDFTWHDMITNAGATNIDYCFENTMDAKRQIQGFTTGILLEGRYQIGDDANADVFTLGVSSAVYSETDMLSQVNATLGEPGKYKFVDNYNGDKVIDQIGEFMTAFVTATDGTPMTEEDAEKLMDAANIGKVTYYPEGRTYYWTRPIKHFGDYYTPIYNDEGKKVDFYESANDYTEENHLGRFGVVRNNWYLLNINSVSGPGYPEIPEIPTDPTDPDDPDDNGWIKCEINILSWAKRSQDVNL